MIDKFLSFEDEAAAKAVLYRIEGAQEANEELGIEAKEGVEVANYMNIDTIGIIDKPTGNVIELEPGILIPQTRVIEGWHVNVRLMPGEDGTPLESYEVYPNSPVRVWA